MAVVTGIAAIGAAIATATVSQVALTVALVGIGTTVIGGITGNKTMQKVGMGLSVAGSVLGLGGMLMGASNTPLFGGSDTAGAASAFAPDAAATSGNLATAPSAMSHGPIDGTLGAQPASLAPSATVSAGWDTPEMGAGGFAPAHAAPAPTLSAQTAPVGTPAWSDPALNANLAGSINQAGHTGAGTVLAPQALSSSVAPITPSTNVGNWWKQLDPSMKVAMAMTAGQGISGLASGYFAGASAEQKLELEKLINQQNQDQRQHYNRNNSYVPSIKFGAKPPGLLAAGQGGTA